MSPALTRRRALLGSAAAAIGVAVLVAVPVAVAATPATVPPVSPEAKALQDELARLSSGYRRACREADEAADRVDYPDPPEALYVRSGDRGLFARQPAPFWADRAEGLDWWADPATVERLRTSSFGYPIPDLDRVSLSYQHTRAGKVWLHQTIKVGRGDNAEFVDVPIASPFCGLSRIRGQAGTACSLTS